MKQMTEMFYLYYKNPRSYEHSKAKSPFPSSLRIDMFSKAKRKNPCTFISCELGGVMFYLSVEMWSIFTGETKSNIANRLLKTARVKNRWTVRQALSLDARPGECKTEPVVIKCFDTLLTRDKL